MNTDLGQRIAEKLAADNLLFRTLGMESHRLAKETEQQAAVIISAEVAPLVEALRKIDKLERDDTSPEVFYFNVKRIIGAALAQAGQEPEEEAAEKLLGNETLPASRPIGDLGTPPVHK